MLKILGMISIMIAGAGAGFLQSDRLDKRVKFLEHYMNFINEINTNIRYSMQPIEHIIKNCRKSKSLSSFIQAVLLKLESNISFKKAWEDSIIILKNENALKQQDLTLIKRFGSGLGNSDLQGQNAHCKISMDMAKVELELAREERYKKSKLYKMLGLSVGLCVALLIV